MTPERIKNFLSFFYKSYIHNSYIGFELKYKDDDLIQKLENYDIQNYFIQHLDIYIENTDFLKEYNLIYNARLFYISKENAAEEFNDLEIFLIENIQLFLHTIFESAIQKLILKENKEIGIFLKFTPIDNKSCKLIDLITEAEENMKTAGINPPAMG